MLQSRSKNQILLPLLSNLTLIGILMYYLGWRYWSEYYSHFSIDTSLIEISFEKIIITTWNKIIYVFIVFAVIWDDMWRNDKKDYELGHTLFSIVTIIVFQLDYEYSWVAGCVLIIFYFIIYKILIKKNFQFQTITKFQLNIIIGVSMYFFGIYYYGKNGRKDAEEFYKNYEENIELVTNSNKNVNGKFLTHMSEKYFIIVEDQRCKKNIIAFEDSNISNAKFHKPTKFLKN